MQSSETETLAGQLGLRVLEKTALDFEGRGTVHAQITSQRLPLERAYYWERNRPSRLFLMQPVKGRVQSWNWARTMNEARRVAAYLSAQDWEPGSRIVILSKNCAWWIMAELAIWMAGHVTVPVYTSLPSQAAQRLIEHCGAVACFVGALENPDLITQAIPDKATRIHFPNAPDGKGIDWQTIVAETEQLVGNPRRSGNDLATIIYTSGTTGTPKGVMHRFASFPYFAKAVVQVVGRAANHRVLSYLPLAHIAERALTETTAIDQGWRIYFCESAATFMEDLKRARPTVFFSVPRLYMKFQQGVLARVSERKLDHLLSLPLVNYFVRRHILAGLGLSTVRFAASGSAPIPAGLLIWFRKLGLPIAEGYGTTETGITHTAPRGQSRPGYVGRSAPGVETLIAEEDEVLLRSPMNMLGYYRDSDATRNVMSDDGFIRTGDQGELDPEGWLKIKGRLKEQFKTSKGKYVTPSPIELMLGLHEAIESCLVMGSGLAAPVGVIVLSTEAQQIAAIETERLTLEHSLESLLETTNNKLASHERLQFLSVVPSKWTIDRGFITPTLKLKRSVLENYYMPFVSGWAAQDRRIIWHSEPGPIKPEDCDTMPGLTAES